MNRTLKAQLIAISLSLPEIEYKNRPLLVEVTGQEIINQTKKDAEATGKEYVHPVWPTKSFDKILKKEVTVNEPVKPSGKYRYVKGNERVDHYKELVKMYKKDGWPGVEEYQKMVREIYARVEEEPAEQPKKDGL